MQEINWKNILIELLIVFIGVYGAFLLNSYREGIQEDKARIKYYHTFLQSLQESTVRIKHKKDLVDSLLVHVKDTGLSKLSSNRELDFTNTFFILKSAYSDANFASINTRYLINIESGSNLIKQIEKRFNILDEEVRKSEIYGSNNHKNARANFRQWYVNELHFLSNRLGLLIGNIQEGAIPATKKLIEELE